MVNSHDLVITQATVNQLDQAVRRNMEPDLMSDFSMYEVAELVGGALHEVRHRDGTFMMENDVDAGANFIVGGQIAGENQRLFMVYSTGDYIEATAEAPYFQIGEAKYGKPIIDSVIRVYTCMVDAIKCALVPFDSTMRSNLTVGMLIDLAYYHSESLKLRHSRCFDDQDSYMQRLRLSWGKGVSRSFAQLPNFE